MVEKVWTVKRCEFGDGVQEDKVLDEKEDVLPEELMETTLRMLDKVDDETTYVIIMLGE